MTFTSTISYQDRLRLRAIVRKYHLSHYPTDKLTDIECDKLIDAWGAETAGKMIKQAMDRGMF
jgi:hypothetical protein